MSCAVAVIFLGLAGTVKEMLHVGPDGEMMLVGTNCMLASLIGGAVIGEVINLENHMDRFGRWLQQKTGSVGDTRFVDGFVMTSAALKNISAVGSILIFCVGTNLFGLPYVRIANLLPALVIAVVWVLV